MSGLRVRIGMADVAKELVVELDAALSRSEVDQIVAEALSRTDRAMWFEDRRGHRYGVSVEHLVYIEVDDRRTDVGF